MANLLKAKSNYLNKYEEMYNTLSKSKAFEYDVWQTAANSGKLDMYIDILSKYKNKFDRDKLNKDYNYDFADNNTKLSILYNELFADRTDVETERERYLKDASGSYVKDNKGELVIEKYKASDYDYRKELINNATAINYQKYLLQQEEERKNSMSEFEKGFNTILAGGGEVVIGLTDQLDNLFNSIAAIGNGIDAAIKNENIFDAIVDTNASDTWRLFEQLGVQDAIIDFERRYTYMRDLDGNYSDFGKYAGGVCNTVGQMIPSMLIGGIVSKAASGAPTLLSGLGGSVSKTSNITKAISTLVFYQGTTTGNVRSIYNEMTSENVSPPSAAILANATIKSALQYGVEIGLSKLLGGTALDNMVFGREVSVGSGSLSKAAGKRLFHDFVSEGLEEVYQDTTDFLVDNAFEHLIDENFGEISDLSWQSLVDAFVIGGLSSFAGSAFNILTTKNVETPNVKIDKTGNPVYDKDGKPVFQKLNKLQSWEYGLNLQSFMQNFSILQEQGKSLIKRYDSSNKKEGMQYAAAFTEMYAAYRMITSIYGEIGADRFKAANDILTRVTTMINDGKFDSESLRQSATDVLKYLQLTDMESVDIAIKKLEEAKITKVAEVVERNDLSNLQVSDSIKDELTKLFNSDANITKVVLTEDGNNIVYEGNAMFIPIKYATNSNAEIIFSTVAEQKLVDGIIAGKFKGAPLNEVLSVFKQVSGRKNATMREAVYNLVFNDSFFRIMLSTANKDMYNFMSSILEIERSIVSKNLSTAIYSRKLAKVRDNMQKALYDYLINQPFADYKLDIFNNNEDLQRKIAAARWCKNLYGRVVNTTSFKKLTDEDWTVLKTRVNSLPVSQNEKDTILKNLQSEKSDIRTSAMNRIATAYAGVFTSKYDGKIYMPDTNIPNRTFNAFLQNHGFTISTLISTEVDNSVKRSIIDTYGEFTIENLIKFRQSQFMQYCNNNYTFRYNKQGVIGVYEVSTNKQVGFSAYKAQADSLLLPTALDKRTSIDRANKKNYLIRDLLNSEVDAATAAYLSIDDVISDPSLLSEQHQANIQLKYGEVTIENTFMYLREYFINTMKTTTVVALTDGSYAFADIRPMKAALKVDGVKIDTRTKISQLIKPAYLYGRLENVKIKLTNNRIVAEYNAAENTIYINNEVAKRGGDLLTFAFLHEFQHAIQVENDMNIGINSNWINSKHIAKTTRANIIKDVRKHRPELFEGVSKGSDTEAKIVNDFVYFSSGESTAIGIDASKLLDFYPTIVKDVVDGTKVVFPWGTSYNLSNYIPMSFAAAIDLFDIDNLSDEAVAIYKSYIIESYNIIAKSDNYRNISEEQLELFRSSKLFNQLSKLTSENQLDFLINLFTTFDYTTEISDNIKYAEDMYNYFYALAEICNKLLPDQSLYPDMQYLIDLVLPDSALRIKLDTLNSKQYSATEFVKEYYSKSHELSNRIQQLGKKVFDKFEQLSKFVVPNIKKVAWMYNSNAYREIHGTLGFQIGNILRFHTYSLETIAKTKAVETYLHETIHYLTAPVIAAHMDRTLDNEKLNDLLIVYRDIYTDLTSNSIFNGKSHLETYPLRNIDELASGASNDEFLRILRENAIITDRVKAHAEYLVGDVSNDAEILIRIVESIIDNSNDTTLYARTFNKIRNTIAEYERVVYQDTHEGKDADVYYDETNNTFFREDSYTGEVVFKGEPNYFKSNLGQSDNMSIKTSSTKEQELLRNIAFEAEEYIKKNKKLTSQELTELLKLDYQFIPTDIIEEISKAIVGDARVELEKLNERLKGAVAASSVKKSQKRGSKKLDTPTKKRYVSQKKSVGTNLEKFGYTSKYKRTQLSEELQSFIVNATENIDEELWNKVKSGKITTQDVMDYFRDSKTIDDTTFKLINNAFFHNDKIKNFEELQRYIVNETPKYYAMRAISKNLGYENVIMSNIDPNLLDKFVNIINKDLELKKLYDSIVERYYTYKGESLIISEKNLRRLWMQYFDGSAQSAGYLATIAKMGAINKWLITGEGSSKVAKSLQDQVGEDMEIADVYVDKNALNAFDAIFYSTTREQRVEEIMKIMGPKYMKKLLSKGATQRQATAKFHEKWQELMDLDDKEFNRHYAKIVKNMSEEEINNLFAKQLIAESAGLDVTKLSNEELDKLNTVTEKVIPDALRPSSAIVNNIRSIVRTIKSNLSDKDKARFLKENSDIFTDALAIKPELLHKKNDKGLEVYVDPEKLLPLEDRIRQLSKDVRAKVYQSTRSMNFKKQMEKELRKLERENAKLIQKIAEGKTDAVASFEISNEEVVINTTKEIPASLKRLLHYEFTKVVKSKTQYLLEGDQRHFETSIKKFLSDNAAYLQTLSQEDINEIVDFYLTSELLPSTSHAKRYSAIQLAMLTYLIKGNRQGHFVINEDSVLKLEQRAENIVGISAANLANWKKAKTMLKPAEVILQSLAKNCDIEFSTGDIENLMRAVESGDIKRITAAKQKMYDDGLKQYRGSKKSFLSKALQFERMAMLSSPGTWIKNAVSNVTVSGTNLLSEKIGSSVSTVIERMFPKKKWRRDNQYKIIGTKVDSDVQTFIKINLLDNSLLDLITNALNKYDTRQSKTDLFTSEESITKLIAESIKTKIFQDSTFDSEIVNKTHKLLLKALSDEKSINKAAIRYFGKILVEDNVDLTQGLSNEVINSFAEAYKLAAYDYMHKSNFFNKIEIQLKSEFGEAAFFMYKQLFPFAATSWNWFVEGLNYTPVGLAKSIVQFAKLETTIEKIDAKRQRGDTAPSSRFAEYLTKRNIGKGVIGSIGWVIGALLSAFGYAGIDEEDKQYKLFVYIGDEKIYVDISDIFGTQGILLGIATISASKNGDIVSFIGDTLDTMFLDSTFSDVFNSFRYSESFGDWLVAQPFSFLQMFIPNFVKTLSSVIRKHKVKYSSGILGKFEQLAVQSIPGLAYAFPKQVDVYTGETQIAYKLWFATNLANKLLPFKVYPYNVTDIEKEAIAMGVKKGPLTGRYEIDGEGVNLTTSQIELLNEYYGKLNNKTLDKLMSNKVSYRVWNDDKKQYVDLKYNKMTDTQKKTVIERIMNDNSQIAKVYILTSFANWKYYTNESEYSELKRLGIKNVYRKTNKLEGFIKN